MTGKTPFPLDNDQRNLFRNDLTSSMVVEAGAGTGKTSLLIDRLIALVQNFTLTSITAITYTEKAAGEIKDRLRFELEKQLFLPKSEQSNPQLLMALAGLEQARLSTIHAFASGILRERAIEAGIDPDFGHLDEPEETRLLHEAILKRLGSETGELGYWFNRFNMLGGELKHFLDLSLGVLQNRDLLQEYQLISPKFDLNSIMEEFHASLEELVALCESGGADSTDKAAENALGLMNSLNKVDVEKEETAWRWLSGIRSVKTNLGSKRSWSDATALQIFRERISAFKARADEVLRGARCEVLEWMVGWLKDVVDDVQRIKQEWGLVGFSDQLILARNLLQDRSVLRSLQNRYECILIDEFQDTDPLQVQIALLLAGEKPEYTGIREATPAQGKICIVGDPKQSIYRFRRVDPDVYRLAVERIRSTGREIQISQNFRSSPGIVKFINGFFKPIWETAVKGNCRYQPIEPLVDYPDIQPSPPVAVLVPGEGCNLVDLKADEIRTAEAEAIAEAIHNRVVGEGWQIVKPGLDSPISKKKTGYDDIAILFPATTGIDIYINALITLGIPFTIEQGKGFFKRRIIGDIHCCLAAIENPLDRFSVVAALRSALFGVSDTGLLDWLDNSEGLMDYRIPQPGLPEDVTEPLKILDELHKHRHEKSAPELIELLFERTHLRQVLMTEPHNWGEVDCLDRILELSYQHRQEQGSGLHQFIIWLGERIKNQEDDKGGSPSGIGQRGVRLLTMHSAKGLEFPVVFLADLGRSNNRNITTIPDRLNNRIDFSIGVQKTGYFQTIGYDEAEKKELEALQAQEMRLLYVAMTRARNHLVIPLFPRIDKSGVPKSNYLRWLQSFYKGQYWFTNRNTTSWRTLKSEHNASELLRPESTQELNIDPDAIWEQSELLNARNELRLTQSTTRLPKRYQPSRHLAGPVRNAQNGVSDKTVDYAVRIGIAFHTYMSECRPGEPPWEALLDHCAKTEEVDREELEKLVSGCLKSSLWSDAISGRSMWREVPATVQRSDGIMIGVIDLIWEDQNGALHIADYKTGDSDPDRHLRQVRDYIEALESSSGKKIESANLYFARTGKITNIAVK